jgi:hypothetical protein
MVLTARVCGVGFHAGGSCAGIAMWGWPTYLSVVEGSKAYLNFKVYGAANYLTFITLASVRL